MRSYQRFSLEGANFRICSSHVERVKEEIRAQRLSLIHYIDRHPNFLESLTPVQPLPNPPEIVRKMCEASRKVGVGPMASVAGIIAQLAAEAAIQDGAEEAIVENGGDIFLLSQERVIIGIYAQSPALSGKIAFSISPELTPLAVCSSSSHMGHSLSFGDCDLATVTAKDAALADAAATWACNEVNTPEDVDPTLRKVTSIGGISGIMIIKDDTIGLAGDLPELIKLDDTSLAEKITIDPGSDHAIRL